MESYANAASAQTYAPVPSNGLDAIRQRVVETDKRASDILARIRSLADSAFGPMPENTNGMGLVSDPCLSGAVEDLSSTIARIEEALSRL